MTKKKSIPRPDLVETFQIGKDYTPPKTCKTDDLAQFSCDKLEIPNINIKINLNIFNCKEKANK